MVAAGGPEISWPKLGSLFWAESLANAPFSSPFPLLPAVELKKLTLVPIPQPLPPPPTPVLRC